ncbi:MAG: hypothetical protein EOO69_07370 [Moraxellaceae bacterium]|nr:MAG: hypothetical protein EOO69_07370 [Moraxellaceae bacterium]
MNIKNKQKIQPDWYSKTFAGLVLGLMLAIASSVLLIQLLLPYADRAVVPQLGMWSIPWVWLPLFFLAYFIPRGWQAMVIYSVANVLAYSCVFLLRG